MTINDIVSKRLAKAIRERRERSGLTLRGLASKGGISASMISDVERGAKSPTVATLSALCDALNVPVSALFEAPDKPSASIRVSRAAEHAESVDPANGTRRAAYRPALPGSNVELVRVVVPAHSRAGPFAAHGPEIIEHVHVAEGAVRVELGPEATHLETGDCCSCVADATHAFDNTAGDVEALIYVVVERR